MKSIIILILLVGTAVSQSQFTTDVATNWQILSLVPDAGVTYDLVVQYGIGAATGATTQVATSGQDIGLICLVTTSNFSLADGATGQVGWSMSSTATGTTVISSSTGWGNMIVTSLTAITHTSDTSLITTTTGTACATTNVLPVVTVSETLFWFFDITASCTNIPLNPTTTTWYFKKFISESTVVSTNQPRFIIFIIKSSQLCLRI
jgi:hypothetical protein